VAQAIPLRDNDKEIRLSFRGVERLHARDRNDNLGKKVNREDIMKIKEKIENHVAVLSLSGKMMGGPETTALHDHVKGLIKEGINKVVIDLAGVKWINSSGLGVLMATMTTLKSADGQLKLANVTEKVESLLMITQLMRIFETYATVERAVSSLT
jgi:anti-sigma B factor antagonist